MFVRLFSRWLKISFLLFSVFQGITVNGQRLELRLSDVISIAIDNSPAAKQVATKKENRYWQYRYFRSNYNPQLRLKGHAPNYQRETTGVTQPDGTISFLPINQTNTYSNVSLLQQIPWTGGTISVNSDLSYFNNNTLNSSSWNGTALSVQLYQPIFSFNQLKWDKLTEPLRFEESKRASVEEIESISKTVVEKFFAVLESQINLQIATFNLSNSDTILNIEKSRYDIGTTTKDEFLQAKLQYLQSKQDESLARINLKNAKLDLSSYLGLKDANDFELAVPSDIPYMKIDMDEALTLAKANRADYISFQRRRIEAEKEVAQARGQLVETSISASYGLNNTGANVNQVYSNPLQQQTINLTFDVPLLDWGRNKARMRTAIANKRLNDYVIAKDEIAFEQEVINVASLIEALSVQIDITKTADLVAQEKYTVSQERYLMGKTDIMNMNMALAQKDAARRSYINSLKSFWISFYDLRRLTLYDFSSSTPLYEK